MGQTFLCRRFNTLHDHSICLVNGTLFCCVRAVLDPEAWQDLDWWHAVLQANIHHAANVADAATVGVFWGDGSGTGTGGML